MAASFIEVLQQIVVGWHSSLRDDQVLREPSSWLFRRPERRQRPDKRNPAGNMGKRGRLVCPRSLLKHGGIQLLWFAPSLCFFCRVAPAFFIPSSVQNSPDYSAQYRLKWPFYALILSKKAAKEENHAAFHLISRVYS